MLGLALGPLGFALGPLVGIGNWKVSRKGAYTNASPQREPIRILVEYRLNGLVSFVQQIWLSHLAKFLELSDVNNKSSNT